MTKCCDANEIFGGDNHSLDCKNYEKEICEGCGKELMPNETFGVDGRDEPYCKDCVKSIEEESEYMANERADMEREAE